MLDATWALVIEIYGEYGMKFDEANNELAKRLYEGDNTPQAQRARAPRPPDDAASMAMLQAAMKDSDFRGPRG